jgi:hypothetical protein
LEGVRKKFGLDVCFLESFVEKRWLQVSSPKKRLEKNSDLSTEFQKERRD